MDWRKMNALDKINRIPLKSVENTTKSDNPRCLNSPTTTTPPNTPTSPNNTAPFSGSHSLNKIPLLKGDSLFVLNAQSQKTHIEGVNNLLSIESLPYDYAASYTCIDHNKVSNTAPILEHLTMMRPVYNAFTSQSESNQGVNRSNDNISSDFSTLPFAVNPPGYLDKNELINASKYEVTERLFSTDSNVSFAQLSSSSPSSPNPSSSIEDLTSITPFSDSMISSQNNMHCSTRAHNEDDNRVEKQNSEMNDNFSLHRQMMVHHHNLPSSHMISDNHFMSKNTFQMSNAWRNQYRGLTYEENLSKPTTDMSSPCSNTTTIAHDSNNACLPQSNTHPTDASYAEESTPNVMFDTFHINISDPFYNFSLSDVNPCDVIQLGTNNSKDNSPTKSSSMDNTSDNNTVRYITSAQTNINHNNALETHGTADNTTSNHPHIEFSHRSNGGVNHHVDNGENDDDEGIIEYSEDLSNNSPMTLQHRTSGSPNHRPPPPRVYHVVMCTRHYWRVEWVSPETGKRVYKHFGENRYGGGDRAREVAIKFWEEVRKRSAEGVESGEWHGLTEVTRRIREEGVETILGRFDSSNDERFHSLADLSPTRLHRSSDDSGMSDRDDERPLQHFINDNHTMLQTHAMFNSNLLSSEFDGQVDLNFDLMPQESNGQQEPNVKSNDNNLRTNYAKNDNRVDSIKDAENYSEGHESQCGDAENSNINHNNCNSEGNPTGCLALNNEILSDAKHEKVENIKSANISMHGLVKCDTKNSGISGNESTISNTAPVLNGNNSIGNTNNNAVAMNNEIRRNHNSKDAPTNKDENTFISQNNSIKTGVIPNEANEMRLKNEPNSDSTFQKTEYQNFGQNKLTPNEKISEAWNNSVFNELINPSATEINGNPSKAGECSKTMYNGNEYMSYPQVMNSANMQNPDAVYNEYVYNKSIMNNANLTMPNNVDYSHVQNPIITPCVGYDHKIGNPTPHIKHEGTHNDINLQYCVNQNFSRINGVDLEKVTSNERYTNKSNDLTNLIHSYSTEASNPNLSTSINPNINSNMNSTMSINAAAINGGVHNGAIHNTSVSTNMPNSSISNSAVNNPSIINPSLVNANINNTNMNNANMNNTNLSTTNNMASDMQAHQTMIHHNPTLLNHINRNIKPASYNRQHDMSAQLQMSTSNDILSAQMNPIRANRTSQNRSRNQKKNNASNNTAHRRGGGSGHGHPNRTPGRIYSLLVRGVRCWRAEWHDRTSGNRRTRQYAAPKHGEATARALCLQALCEARCVPTQLMREAQETFGYVPNAPNTPNTNNSTMNNINNACLKGNNPTHTNGNTNNLGSNTPNNSSNLSSNNITMAPKTALNSNLNANNAHNPSQMCNFKNIQKPCAIATHTVENNMVPMHISNQNTTSDNPINTTTSHNNQLLLNNNNHLSNEYSHYNHPMTAPMLYMHNPVMNQSNVNSNDAYSIPSANIGEVGAPSFYSATNSQEPQIGFVSHNWKPGYEITGQGFYLPNSNISTPMAGYNTEAFGYTMPIDMQQQVPSNTSDAHRLNKRMKIGGFEENGSDSNNSKLSSNINKQAKTAQEWNKPVLNTVENTESHNESSNAINENTTDNIKSHMPQNMDRYMCNTMNDPSHGSTTLSNEVCNTMPHYYNNNIYMPQDNLWPCAPEHHSVMPGSMDPNKLINPNKSNTASNIETHSNVEYISDNNTSWMM